MAGCHDSSAGTDSEWLIESDSLVIHCNVGCHHLLAHDAVQS